MTPLNHKSQPKKYDLVGTEWVVGFCRRKLLYNNDLQMEAGGIEPAMCTRLIANTP